MSFFLFLRLVIASLYGGLAILPSVYSRNRLYVLVLYKMQLKRQEF